MWDKNIIKTHKATKVKMMMIGDIILYKPKKGNCYDMPPFKFLMSVFSVKICYSHVLCDIKRDFTNYMTVKSCKEWKIQAGSFWHVSTMSTVIVTNYSRPFS